MNGLNLKERILLTKIMGKSQFLRVRCKADLKQAVGSMFIVIDEESEDNSEYRIVNDSSAIDLHYC
jgi:hypothetical protein